jgi:hypothetical protein
VFTLAAYKVTDTTGNKKKKNSVRRGLLEGADGVTLHVTKSSKTQRTSLIEKGTNVFEQ